MTNCIIVDDEQPARALLELYLSGMKEFSLAASFSSAIEACNYLQKNQVDLIFLDIQMPGYSGLQLIRSMPRPLPIILTTAYREYAAEAFDLDVVDYLVKPITQERFIRALSKFNQSLSNPAVHQASTEPDKAYIFLKIGTGQARVYLNDIIYVEGLRDFTRVYTSKQTFIASERISYMEEKLPATRFARIHKSYIISLEKISLVQADSISLGAVSLPLGRMFKQSFLKKLPPAKHTDKKDKPA